MLTLTIKALTTLALALLAGQVTAVAVAAPSSSSPNNEAAPLSLETRKWRSNIDMVELCSEQYDGPYKPVTRGDSCFDWACDVKGRQRGVNVNKYCTDRFGSDAYATCASSLYDWQCHDRT